MYDTVNFRREVAGGQLPAILKRLTGIKEHIPHSEQGKTCTGYLDNYKVSVSEVGIWLKGSLAKFYLGDNISTLTRSDAGRAIEKLSDTIGLHINKAKVTRIDIGANLLMIHQPEAYYPFLIECRPYDRNQKKGSLYFEIHKHRTMIFYNKIKEATAKGVNIPEPLQGKNLLRYELRFEKRVNRQLNSDVTTAMLSDEKFYIKILNRWYAEYQNISKKRDVFFNKKNMKSPKDYWKQKNGQAIHIIGLDAALKEVDQLKAMQTFAKPEYYSRLRREIREHYTEQETTEPVELIKELDLKVHRAIKFYR